MNHLEVIPDFPKFAQFPNNCIVAQLVFKISNITKINKTRQFEANLHFGSS
jgi:hypothetical protein